MKSNKEPVASYMYVVLLLQSVTQAVIKQSQHNFKD